MLDFFQFKRIAATSQVAEDQSLGIDFEHTLKSVFGMASLQTMEGGFFYFCPTFAGNFQRLCLSAVLLL
jgi:hypothetical protein